MNRNPEPGRTLTLASLAAAVQDSPERDAGRSPRSTPRFDLAIKAFGALLVGAALAAGSAVHAADADARKFSAEHGQSSVAEARVVTMDALPQASAAAAAALPSPRPRGGVNEAEYATRKAAASRQANGAGVPSAQDGQTRYPDAAPDTPGASLVFTGLGQSGSVPSDMALAVSNTWVVQVVNSRIAVYNKTGGIQAGFPKALGGTSGFFPSATTDTGDPRAFYDRMNNRFVVVADDFTGGAMWLAASQTNDPRGAWNIYKLAPWGAANCRVSGNACPDFPMIGFDDQTIYLSLNYFPAAGGVSDWMLLLPKKTIYAGGGFGYNFFSNFTWGGIAIDSMQPVSLLSAADHPRAGFAVASFNINFGGGQCSGSSGCSGIMVWAFSNNLQAAGSPGPEWSAVLLPTATTYRFPANANQKGFPFSVDTGDTRISGSPFYHGGHITASVNTNGTDGRAHHAWFEIRPFLNDNDARCTGAFANLCAQVTGAEMVNEDCYYCGGGFNTNGSSYFASLAPDSAGNLTMAFNLSDDNTYPSTAYTSRRVTYGKNLMHDAGIYMCSGASANLSGRMGDYSASAGDVTAGNSNVQWFSSMHMGTGGAWSTCIGKNGFTTAVNVP